MFRLACVLVIAVAATGILADEPEKLIGGHDIDIRSNPYVASIRIDGRHVCGGAILTQRHILTAGHCLANIIRDPNMNRRVTVVTGTHNLNRGGNYRGIVGAMIHPKYVNFRGGYDVAVIKLYDPIMFNVAEQPIAVSYADAPNYEDVFISGWGSTSYPSNGLYPNLQQIRVVSINNKQCSQYYQQNRVISEGEFCTFLRRGTGVCVADDGNPVVCRGVLVGIVSTAVPCAVGLPDVHTNLFRVRDFIAYATNL